MQLIPFKPLTADSHLRPITKFNPSRTIGGAHRQTQTARRGDTSLPEGKMILVQAVTWISSYRSSELR